MKIDFFPGRAVEHMGAAGRRHGRKDQYFDCDSVLTI